MTEEVVRAEQGLGFDNVPEIYDRVRPTYPPELFDELLSYLGSAPERGLRAVEIGPATGQATRSLLERGIAVTAVEPGARLAAYLSRKLADFSTLEVVNAKFEDAPLEPGAYDLILAATSFHWVDRASRWERCQALLNGRGALAIVSTNQIESVADGGFFARVQPVYDRHQPDNGEDEGGFELPGEDVVPQEYTEIDASQLFGEVALHRYRWDQRYTTQEYGDLMRSYSRTQAMEPAAQDALISDVCALIDSEFGGSITRPLVITLTLGRRRAVPA